MNEAKTMLADISDAAPIIAGITFVVIAFGVMALGLSGFMYKRRRR